MKQKGFGEKYYFRKAYYNEQCTMNNEQLTMDNEQWKSKKEKNKKVNTLVWLSSRLIRKLEENEEKRGKW
jgi:hypothetical protein